MNKKNKRKGSSQAYYETAKIEYSFNNKDKEKINFKLLVLEGLRKFAITIIASTVVIGGCWLLFRIFS